MSKKDKRIEAARSNPRDVRPEDLEAILLACGFERRPGKGDHRGYKKGIKKVTIDFGRSPAHPKTVAEVLDAIDGEV